MKVRCTQCKYYFVTWDANAPYGCKRLGFKSKLEPSAHVLKYSGKPCLSFEEKAPRTIK